MSKTSLLSKHVTLDPFFYPSAGPRVHVVTDSRLQGGVYTFTVHPVDGSPLGYDPAGRLAGVPREDLTIVGEGF